MQYSSLPFLALVASINAQVASLPDLTKLPQCAQKAATTGIAATNCQLTDFTCICESSAFLRAVGVQIAAVCSPEDQKATVDFAKSICLPLGVAIGANGIAEDGSQPSSSPAAEAQPVEPSMSAAPVAEEKEPEATGPTSTYVAPNAHMGASTAMGAPYPTHHTMSSATGTPMNGTKNANGTVVPFEGGAGGLNGRGGVTVFTVTVVVVGACLMLL